VSYGNATGDQPGSAIPLNPYKSEFLLRAVLPRAVATIAITVALVAVAMVAFRVIAGR